MKKQKARQPAPRSASAILADLLRASADKFTVAEIGELLALRDGRISPDREEWLCGVGGLADRVGVKRYEPFLAR